MDLKDHNLGQFEKYPYTLVLHLFEEHKDEFDKWWDPRKVDLGSWLVVESLIEEFPKEFHKWWDPERIPLESSIPLLARYCSDYIEDWFDPDSFPWEEFSYILPRYYGKDFDLWWFPERFNWEDPEAVMSLFSNCADNLPKIVDYLESRAISKRSSVQEGLLTAAKILKRRGHRGLFWIPLGKTRLIFILGEEEGCSPF